MLVFPDVDVSQVAQLTVAGKFLNMGQVCIAPTRFYVHKSIFEQYVAAAVRCAAKLTLGNGLDEDTDCGPLFDERSVEKAEQFIQDAIAKGAEVVFGGRRPDGLPRGFFFEPTLLTNVSSLMRLTCEEIFGPIMPIMSFDSTEEAIQLANNTDYGLASYVFTEDLSTAVHVAEALEFGIVSVNDMFPAAAEAPFGGMKESGIGREGGTEGIESYAMKPKKFLSPLLDEYRGLMEQFKFFLPNGGPYGFVDVAEGKIDCYFARQQPFVDVFSGILVAEQAGVEVSDFEGNPVTCRDDVETLFDVVACTNPTLHAKVLEEIAKCKSAMEETR